MGLESHKAPERQETDRLLTNTKDDSFDIEAGEQHSFEGGLVNCCGNCDQTGWTICVLGYFVPCILFGWNAKRSLGKSAVKYALLSFLLMGLGGILYQVARPFYQPQFTAACGPDPFQPYKTQACNEAIAFQNLMNLILFAVLLILGLAMALWGAKVRRDMRNKLNIPGTYFGDFCTWFWCSRCALCQETRTVRTINVQAEIWDGP